MVFISDLHLHPEEPLILSRFLDFIRWAREHAHSVYILGDFFHVWPGDEALDAWSLSIADQLASLVKQGIAVYFMPGNRDFLLGKNFVQRSAVQWLPEPFLLEKHGLKVLLVHGDQYCTHDWSHQWLRYVTRRDGFIRYFKKIPYAVRRRLVECVRKQSKNNRQHAAKNMELVVSEMLKHMHSLNVQTIIHGHIHRPGYKQHKYLDQWYQHYVLSDWDDNPQLLSYNKTNGFCFIGEDYASPTFNVNVHA